MMEAVRDCTFYFIRNTASVFVSPKPFGLSESKIKVTLQ